MRVHSDAITGTATKTFALTIFKDPLAIVMASGVVERRVGCSKGCDMNQFELTILAQLSAHRELMVTLFVYRFLQEANPLKAAYMVKDMFDDSPTTAPRDGTCLDPATSDLLAAMTDEAIEDIMDRVIERVEFCIRDEPEAMPEETSLARSIIADL